MALPGSTVIPLELLAGEWFTHVANRSGGGPQQTGGVFLVVAAAHTVALQQAQGCWGREYCGTRVLLVAGSYVLAAALRAAGLKLVLRTVPAGGTGGCTGCTGQMM